MKWEQGKEELYFDDIVVKEGMNLMTIRGKVVNARVDFAYIYIYMCKFFYINFMKQCHAIFTVRNNALACLRLLKGIYIMDSLEVIFNIFIKSK